MAKHPIYHTQVWRDLPRDECIVEFLLGDAVGPCHGLVHRHHVDPDDPFSRTYSVCNGHHQRMHTILRALDSKPKWKHCNHTHRYPGAKEACERRLNRDLVLA